MNTPSPFVLALALGLGCTGAVAAVSLDGLAAKSPFMPQQEEAAAPVVTEGAAIEFRGLIATKDGVLFGLYDRSRNLGAWVGEKEKGAEFVVQGYDAANDLVTVDYQGRKFTLPLSASRIGTAAPSPVAVVRPSGPSISGGSVSARPAQADATRLESVAAEVRRRRALRQAALSGTSAPTAPAAGNGK
jgi:hypothetical protein